MKRYYFECKNCRETVLIAETESSDKYLDVRCTKKRCRNIENLKLIYGESFPETYGDADLIKNDRVKLKNASASGYYSVWAAVEIIRGYFAKSIMQGDASGKNHADFREYLQAWIYNETKKPIIIEDEKLLNQMIERFGKKKSSKLRQGYSCWNIYKD